MTDRLDSNDLVGREIVLIVSDPWDYKGADGTNMVAARVVSVKAEEGRSLLAEAHQEVAVSDPDARGFRLDIRCRYEKHRLDDIAAGKRVPVNVGIVEPGKSDSEVVHAFIGLVFLKGCESGDLAD